MGAGIDQAALFHGAVVGVLHGRLPHLVQDVDVADTHRLEARLVVDRHVFDGAPMLSKMPPMTWAMTIWLDQFLIGILIGSLLSALAVPAIARTAADTIPAIPPFIFRLTTLLPLSMNVGESIADACGRLVNPQT